MSVRTEARDQLSPAMQQALHVPVDALQQAGVPMNTAIAPSNGIADMSVGAPSEHALAEANAFNTSNPDHPLNRTVVVSIRASLNDLCLKKTAAIWAPSSEATKAILQQVRALRAAHSPNPRSRRPAAVAAQVRRPRRHRRGPGRPQGPAPRARTRAAAAAR